MTTSDAYSAKCMEELGEAASDREFFACVLKAEDETTRTQLKCIALIFSGVLVFAMQVRVCANIHAIVALQFCIVAKSLINSPWGPVSMFSICGLGRFCYAMCRLCSEEKYSKYVA